jgi:hypothetical protein
MPASTGNGGTFQITDLSYNGTYVRFAGDTEIVSLRRGTCTLHGNGVIGLGSSPADMTSPERALRGHEVRRHPAATAGRISDRQGLTAELLGQRVQIADGDHAVDAGALAVRVVAAADPDHLQPGVTRSPHVELEIVADMQHLVGRKPEAPASLGEDARIGFANTELARAQAAPEPRRQADACQSALPLLSASSG